MADILRGQWLALRWQFFKPLLFVIALELVFVALLHGRHQVERFAVVAALVVLVFDIPALTLVSMFAALRSKGQTQATVSTVARILILPWVVFGMIHAITAFLYWLALLPWEPNDRIEVAQWLGISIAVDLIFGMQAWLALRNDFRKLATQSPERTNWRSWLRRIVAGTGALAGRVIPVRLRIPVTAGLGVVAVVGIVHIARPRHVETPATVVVLMTQSNGPPRVVSDGQGVFFVMPDGSMWRWGFTSAPRTSRLAVPQQVGTNRDWIKAVASGQRCLGLRADGTIWELGLSPWQPGLAEATNGASPQLAIGGSNWIDIGNADPGYSIALKADGTLWSWRGLAVGTAGNPATIGMASNWTAVSSRGDSNLGLQADGTLWAWGRIMTSRNGSYWTSTNIDLPVRLCVDTNWTGLEANGQARNQAGELWDAAFRMPNPQAAAATVCRRITNTSAVYRSDSAPYWLSCQIRPNGTLWTLPARANSPGWNVSSQVSTAPSQIGNRSDWLEIWGGNGTAFGLTADGVLLRVWGVDVGREPVVDSRSRFQLLREVLNGQAQNYGNIWRSGGAQLPVFEEPRPLMKLVTAPQR